MTEHQKLVAEVEAFLLKHSMGSSIFGRLYNGNPAFVLKMRRGRELRIDAAAKLRAWMAAYRPPKRARPGNSRAAVAA